MNFPLCYRYSKIRVSLCFSCGYPSISAVTVISALAESIIGFQNMFTAQKPAHLLLPLQSDRCSKPLKIMLVEGEYM